MLTGTLQTRHEALLNMVTRKPLADNENTNTAPHGSPQVRLQQPGHGISSNPDFRMTQDPVRCREGQHDTTQCWSSPTMANGNMADGRGLDPQVNTWMGECENGQDGTPKAGSRGDVPHVLPQPGLTHHEGKPNSSTTAIDRTPSTSKSSNSSSRQETNRFELEGSNSHAKAAFGATNRALSRKPSNPFYPPSAALSAMNLGECNNTSRELERSQGGPSSAAPQLAQPDLGEDIWDTEDSARQDATMAATASTMSVSPPSEGEGDAWYEDSREKSRPSRPNGTLEEHMMFTDSYAWDRMGSVDKGKGPAKSFPVLDDPSGGTEDWVDVQPPGQFNQIERGDVSKGKHQFEDSGPSIATPQRPVSKSETYQIKKISWHDATAPTNARQSPILVQNENGPCPLVALVNALILTTPTDIDTALVGTLRSREQVSLSLLLDAVFDELTSSRRAAERSELPDITELYAFLVGLHTGMNVNPRFIPTPDVMEAFKRTSLTHLHPTQRGDLIPGTFENTKEMALYSTFAIPLIHGWLPYTEEAAYGALKRHAASYEDAQKLLFREEELEEKLSNPEQKGLTEEEQNLYQDILHIKAFLDASATQLTRWGLEVITKAMKPGSIAILFRNDHFSTLYRHPKTLQILALVTDAGYANHAEVVWESIVDVKGENAEFLSGDFRSVGENGNLSTPGQADGSRKDGHEAPLVSHEQEDMDLALALQLQEEEEQRAREESARRRQESQLSEHFIEQQARSPGPTPRGGHGPAPLGSPRSVKAGGFRAAVAAGLSRRSSASTPAPMNSMAPPPHQRAPSVGSHNVNALGIMAGGAPSRQANPQNVRSLLPHAGQPVNRSAQVADDDAPPSYEQASKMPTYQPPQGHPSHPGSSPDTSRQEPNASVSSPGTHRQYGPSSAGRVPSGPWPGPSGGPGRVRPSPAVGGANGDVSGRDKDCVVM